MLFFNLFLLFIFQFLRIFQKNIFSSNWTNQITNECILTCRSTFLIDPSVMVCKFLFNFFPYYFWILGNFFDPIDQSNSDAGPLCNEGSTTPPILVANEQILNSSIFQYSGFLIFFAFLLLHFQFIPLHHCVSQQLLRSVLDDHKCYFEP